MASGDALKAAVKQRETRRRALPDHKAFRAFLNGEKSAEWCRAQQERMKREALERMGRAG